MTRLRRWADFTLQFDFPATEEEAADAARIHLSKTGVFVHEIQVLVPDRQRVAGVGTVYTWSYRADLEFEPLEDESRVVTLGPTGLVGLDGRPLGN